MAGAAVAAAGEADHRHAGGQCGRDPGQAVLDHQAVARVRAQARRGVEEEIGGWLAARHLDGAVDVRVEAVVETRCAQGGAEAFEATLPKPKSPAEVAAIPDDRWLATMTRAVFQAGFSWKVIENNSSSVRLDHHKSLLHTANRLLAPHFEVIFLDDRGWLGGLGLSTLVGRLWFDRR